MSTIVTTAPGNPRYGPRAPLTGKEMFEQRDHDAERAWLRETPPNDDDGMDTTEVLESVFANPDLYPVAETVRSRPANMPGAPAHFPPWAMVAFGFLISHYGSARKVHFALRVPRNWQMVLDIVAATAGRDAVDGLHPKARAKAPSRNHWNYWLRVHAAEWDAMQATYLPLAVRQAKDQGLLDPDAPTNRVCPPPGNRLRGDGKVMNPPAKHKKRVKDPVTGALVRPPGRRDPASDWWKEGGAEGEDVYGPKVVATAVHGQGWINRVMLLVDPQPKRGRPEADIAMDQIRRILAVADGGVDAVCWDGALHHAHIDPLMREHGLVVVSPPTAKSNPDGDRAGSQSKTRVEKERHYKTLRHRGKGGPCEHVLYARGGRVGEKVVDGTSGETFVPLVIDKLVRNSNVGSYRWYHETTVPCDTNGDHTERVRLTADDDDASAGFLRSEYLRQLPADTKAYARVYGTRPAAESDNSQREHRYNMNLMPAYGEPRQMMIMFGFQFLENSKARWAHQRRQARAT